MGDVEVAEGEELEDVVGDDGEGIVREINLGEGRPGRGLPSTIIGQGGQQVPGEIEDAEERELRKDARRDMDDCVWRIVFVFDDSSAGCRVSQGSSDWG